MRSKILRMLSMGEFELRITLEEYEYNPKILYTIKSMKSDAVKSYDSELFGVLSYVEEVFLQGCPNVESQVKSHTNDLQPLNRFSDN